MAANASSTDFKQPEKAYAFPLRTPARSFSIQNALGTPLQTFILRRPPATAAKGPSQALDVENSSHLAGVLWAVAAFGSQSAIVVNVRAAYDQTPAVNLQT